MTAMDVIVKVTAVLYLVLSTVLILTYPFLIGRERRSKKHTADDYVTVLISIAGIAILAGRVLEWW